MTLDKASDPVLSSSRRPSIWIAVGVAVLVIIAGALWYLWPSGEEPKAVPGPTQSPLRVPPGPAQARVASSGRVIEMPVLYPAIKAVVPPGLKWDGPGAGDPNLPG